MCRLRFSFSGCGTLEFRGGIYVDKEVEDSGASVAVGSLDLDLGARLAPDLDLVLVLVLNLVLD